MTEFLEICFSHSAWRCFDCAETTETNIMAVLNASNRLLYSCPVSCTVMREPAQRAIQCRRLSRVGHYQYCCQENCWTNGVETWGLFTMGVTSEGKLGGVVLWDFFCGINVGKCTLTWFLCFYNRMLRWFPRLPSCCCMLLM
jgi:hypothetical protein